jgi:hypothetical protein
LFENNKCDYQDKCKKQIETLREKKKSFRLYIYIIIIKKNYNQINFFVF